MSHALLDVFFPPSCLLCETQVSQHGTLCMGCWNGITFLAPPLCACCGVPFSYTLGDGARCSDCIHSPPPFAQTRAALAYDTASSNLIKQLKYHDQTLLAQCFAPWMAQAGQELIRESTLITPVPLHYGRFVRRRYNQSALLAQALAKRTGLACVPDLLTRVRPTAQQTGLTKKEREANVRGAFAVPAGHLKKLRGARVLLVDDVLTTGATLAACTEALHAAGAGMVRVLTLARRL